MENIDTNITGAENTTATENNEEMVSMSKTDFEKALQSEGDKVRSKLSKEIKDLKAKLPVEKTETEIEIENRLSEIKTKELEMESKEKDLNIRAALQDANIDRAIADYLKSDVDVGALVAALDKVLNARIVAQGYVPSKGHDNNTGLSREQWDSLSYTEMVKLYDSNPEMVKKYMGK